MKIKIIGFISPEVLKGRVTKRARIVKPLKVSFGTILLKAFKEKINA